ncbi:cobalamin biosynthesis protein CobW [Pelagibius litoralis]|uniref:Cobalamin biosynthesis protein CobW n=1 Tax=Pelagibius litoralis TaxID=374515 RepID=A0A967C2B8_9PROT|nr:cobalamin biosynthesis protein CobW [Pelagibius litoralis]NIA69151.1 cobalamin biosynthesis protein CobW [Pelagibius litoralis]
MEKPSKIPATVITGFLGAGKTSAIRHLLQNAKGRRIALVINEFGDLGVDGEILKGCGIEDCGEEDVVELANGCICCTVADDFLPTIQALLDRADPPDHIVIETSGLALPKPLVKAFAWPEVRTRTTVDGVITMIDGPAVADGLFAGDPEAVAAQREADENLDHETPLEELFEEQLACADMVVINKADMLDDAQLQAVEATVARHLRPAVKSLRTSHGAVDIAVLLGLDAAAEDDLDSRHSHHDAAGEHDHDDFTSFSIALGEAEAPEALLARLLPVIAEHGILRVKGFAAVTGKAMRLVVQGVGDRLQHYYDRDWQPGEERSTRLVIIGETGLDEAAIRAALAS